MAKVKHYFQLIVFDTLAIICMIGAIATGWLPGPGGIPLFIIGLSLLAINHEWAERYIEILRRYADKLGNIIFTPRLRVFFDVVTLLLLILGTALVYAQNAIWMISLGIFSLGMSLLLFLGNRNRWIKLKATITQYIKR